MGEPGSNQQIKDFTKKYGVEFPVTEKVDVNGPKTHPFFLYLKEKGPSTFLGKDAKWNFEKFLVDREGNVVKRYNTPPAPWTSRGTSRRSSDHDNSPWTRPESSFCCSCKTCITTLKVLCSFSPSPH